MSTTKCEIKFDDNPLGIYNAGQTLSGRVELHLDKPKQVNAFNLIIAGTAEIEWSEEDSNKDSTTYRGNEELLRAKVALIPRSNAGSIEIPPGLHVYNFSCNLPTNLPTSFEGEYGKIRYTACAILDRPWKFNQSCKVAFTVLKVRDLNREILPVSHPTKIEEAKKFFCWPCSSSPLYITVEIPVTGYVPGQMIPIAVTLNNTSSVNVKGIKCKLDRTVSFISQSPFKKTKEISKTLAQVSTMVTNSKNARYVQQLEVPSVAPSGKCSVLTLEYELKVTVQVDSCRINPRFQIPIIIGTVPLQAPRTSAEMGWVPSNTPGASYGTFGRNAPTAPPMSAVADVPPTYEEAVHGTMINVNDDPNAIGSQPYVPRYPVYKFGGPEKC